MSHEPSCEGEAVIRVQGETEKGTKGTTEIVMVHGDKGTGVVIGK